MKHRWLVFAAAFSMGCAAARRGGGNTAAAGDSCTAKEADGDEQLCTASREQTLECKSQGTGYVWKVDKDCAALGQTCSGGVCVEKSAAPDTKSGGKDSSTSTGCPDFSGSWEFEHHCEAEYVGTTVSVSQSGCKVTFSGGGLTSASGTISAEAQTLSVTGTSSNGPISCVGTYENKDSGVTGLELDCPSCNIEVKRP